VGKKSDHERRYAVTVKMGEEKSLKGIKRVKGIWIRGQEKAGTTSMRKKI